MEYTEQLENIIDKQGLPNTLQDIADICRMKSDHIFANWQEKPLSDDWNEAADQIEALITK